MAQRIRTVKPELHSDESTATLADAQFRLFVGLYSLADDEGRFRASPAYIAGALFWGAQRPLESVASDLAELQRRKLIVRYSANGGDYGAIVGWRDQEAITYQQINKFRASKLPAPDGSAPVAVPEDDGSPTGGNGMDLDLDLEGKGSGSGSGGDGRAGKRRSPTEIDPSWSPEAGEIELARSLGLDPALQAERFRDHQLANARTSADWSASFRNWIRKAPEFAPKEDGLAHVLRVARGEIRTDCRPFDSPKPGPPEPDVMFVGGQTVIANKSEIDAWHERQRQREDECVSPLMLAFADEPATPADLARAAAALDEPEDDRATLADLAAARAALGDQ